MITRYTVLHEVRSNDFQRQYANFVRAFLCQESFHRCEVFSEITLKWPPCYIMSQFPNNVRVWHNCTITCRTHVVPFFFFYKILQHLAGNKVKFGEETESIFALAHDYLV